MDIGEIGMKPLYTIQRYRPKSDKLFGAIHYSDDGNTTLCGLEIDDRWWILTNNRDGEATCKKCLSGGKK